MKAGFAEIEVNFEINYDNSYYNTKLSNTFKGKLFHINVIAKVADPISTQIPTYINGAEGRSDLLLIPPESKYKINSNRSFGYKYSLACSSSRNTGTCGGIPPMDDNNSSELGPPSFNDIVNIYNDGTIVSNNQRGRANVLIEDSYRNNEFQLVNLLVTPVYSIFVYDSYKASVLPLNSSTKLKIMLQDEFGRLFPDRLSNQHIFLNKIFRFSIQKRQVSSTKFVSIRSRSRIRPY